MNREDIIRMAREAGFYVNEKARQHQPNCISHTYHMIDEQLERFAALVAAAERESWPAEMEAMERQVNILTDALAQAVAAEREACAKWLDERDAPHWAEQIRARGQA